MSPMKQTPQPSNGETLQSQSVGKEKQEKMTPEEADRAVKATNDKVGRIAEAIQKQMKKNPSERLKKIHEKLAKLDKKLNQYHEYMERYAESVQKTVTNINKVINEKLPDIKKQLLSSSLKGLQNEELGSQAWAESLITTYSMLEDKQKVTQGSIQVSRVGNMLSVKMKDRKYPDKYVLESDRSSWKIKNEQGENLAAETNPLAGINWKPGGKSLMNKFDVKAKRITQTTEKSPVKAKKTPDKTKETATKPKEVKETAEQKQEKIADLFKTIANPDEHLQKLTTQQQKILDEFVNSVEKGKVKHFVHGNIEAYVARSVDGAAWRINTRLKDRKGDTTDALDYYVPRMPKKIIGTLPDRYRMAKFTKSPKYTIKSPSELAAERKPKEMETAKKAVKPDKDILEKYGPKEKKEYSEAAKAWLKQLSRSVNKLVTMFSTYQSKLMDVAKLIMQKNPDNYEDQPSRNKVYTAVSNWFQNMKNLNASIDDSSPPKANENLKRIMARLPEDAGDDVAEKYDVKPYNGPLYASLTKKIPTTPSLKPQGSIDKKAKKTQEIKGGLNFSEQGETIYGKINNPIFKEKNSVHVSKIIDENTFVLRDVAKLKIHDLLKTPKGKAVSIQIKRKNGDVVNAVCDSGDKTYYVTDMGKREGKRVRIYNGDTLNIKKVYSYDIKADQNINLARKSDKLKAKPKQKISTKESRAKHDEMVSNNQQTIIKQLQTLKPEEGLSFTLKSGKKVRMYKAPEGQKGYKEVDEKGNEKQATITDVTIYAQQLADQPNFQKLT